MCCAINSGLTSPRFGCGAGECGTCAVIIDGEDRASCSVEIGNVAGRAITTVEGIGTAQAPHPLQTAFIEKQAGQCGYCLSGLIVGAKVLLDRNPSPTRADVAAALAWHLCRCGVAQPRHRRGAARVPTDAGGGTVIPPTLEANPILSRWVRVEPDGHVRVAFGKVEYGQGAVTALAQIAAEELDVTAFASADHERGDRRRARRRTDGRQHVDRDVGRIGARGVRGSANAVRRRSCAPAWV